MKLMQGLFVLLSCMTGLALNAECKKESKIDEDKIVKVAIFEFPPLVNIENGRAYGLGIKTTCEILARLGLKPRFIQYPGFGSVLTALKAGDVDMDGGFFTGVTGGRLLDFNFLVVANRPSFTTAMVFYKQTNPLPPITDPNAAYEFIIDNNLTVGVPFGTRSETTLRFFGVTKLFNNTGADVEKIAQDFIDQKYSVVLTGDESSVAETLAGYPASVRSDLTVVKEVPIAPSTISLGAGSAINKDRCLLAIQLQEAFDSMVDDGSWQNFVKTLKRDPNIDPLDTVGLETGILGKNDTFVPKPWHSVSAGAIYSDCIPLIRCNPFEIATKCCGTCDNRVFQPETR